MSVLADVTAAACGLLFAVAALGKLENWQAWSRLTDELPGRRVLRSVSQWTVPVLELAVAILSFAMPTLGLAGGGVLLAGFALAVFILTRRLSGRECNCFGAIAPATLSTGLALRNVGLAVIAIAGWYLAEHEHLRALPLSGVVLAVVAGTTALMVSQCRRLRRAARPASRPPKEA